MCLGGHFLQVLQSDEGVNLRDKKPLGLRFFIVFKWFEKPYPLTLQCADFSSASWTSRERRSLKGDVLARQTWEMAVMCHEESFMSHWEHHSCFPCILSPKDAFGRAQEANFAQHWPGWSRVRHDKEIVSANLAAWRNGRGPSSVWLASKC